jgi:hypothetical protein
LRVLSLINKTIINRKKKKKDKPWLEYYSP